MFVLTQDGKLFVYRIEETPLSREEVMFNRMGGGLPFKAELIIESPIQVKDLPPMKMFASGIDHLIMLDRNGQVWAMGDDTFGQCGQGAENRQMVAPFYEVRHRVP